MPPSTSSLGDLGISTLYQMRRQDYKNLQQAVQSNDIAAALQTLGKYQTPFSGANLTGASPISSSPQASAQAKLINTILSGQSHELAQAAPVLATNESDQTNAFDTLASLLKAPNAGSDTISTPGLATFARALSSYAVSGADAG